MRDNGGQAVRTCTVPAPAPRAVNTCNAVARFIAGQTVVCGQAKCPSCPSNRGAR